MPLWDWSICRRALIVCGLGLTAALVTTRPGGATCCLINTSCSAASQTDCEGEGGEFICAGACNGSGCEELLNPPPCPPTATPTDTPMATATATVTATATAIATPVPNGGDCTTSNQCASLTCLNGVCEPASPAPATSASGLVVALAILVGLGGLGLWRMRRPVQ